jgi:RNA polymerase sigma-54 factor
MAISAKLEMRQGQSLVMTPQLQQAIRLLQLSNMELTAFVETELERNPLLERAETDDDGPQSETDAGPSASSEEVLNFEGLSDSASRELDTDAENVYPDASASDLSSDFSPSLGGTTPMSSGMGDGDSNLEAYVGTELSLKDHLIDQIGVIISDPVERMIAHYLIDFVDEAGYLRVDLADAAEKLGAPVELVEAVLAKAQTCEPAGLFARSLTECLSIQLAERNRLDPMMVAFLENLDRLAAHDIQGLRSKLRVDAEDLADLIADVRALDPKPGLQFGSTTVQPIVPDVMVRGAKDGSWIVELNSETLPRVLVDRTYYARVSSSAKSDTDKDYLVECLQTANWLVKSLDQRARTILRVSEEIVRQQDGFFTHGVQHLRPLNLRTVADAISMHESTVSRVTSNKYMATPRGIFELKYFFTSAIASADDGDAYSSEAVRYRIKALIDAETASGVLSDDKIVEKLKDEGIDIARRTVAKYREAMHIPSSIQRRRQKKAAEQMART